MLRISRLGEDVSTLFIQDKVVDLHSWSMVP